ncbi:YheC/YheD family protein [Cohnella lubricantis]|uniref:YheC/YheD family protein n=1 Tax=Cohnella lubricantis TaxID=2163172 RepID=A0A841T7S3_9BACL|nr:YheC/YheD family protein [Cohnella lubricantis]MBB6677563.1 YheC/YheD family protein [Cohnella lubricantis]MBP2116551.1 glutathione synthase/RimK-type ligase-like ATP-grasp enzyme [Cohnella lubricantis]
MATPKIDVQVISSGILPEDVLALGESVIKQAKIPVQQPLSLQFGSARQTVSIVSVSRYDGMRISQSLAGKWGLHSGARLRLQYRSGSRTLALGPLIGVLVSRDYIDQPDKPFGSITMFCRELTDTCRSQGAYVYFFTPSAIHSDLRSVEGWVWGGGSWYRTTLPAPDVVNNRLTSRKLENRPIVQQFFREIKQRYGAVVFNEKFLDKSEVFEALAGDTSLQRYLPESHTLRNYTMLKSMCARYPVVFLKPVRGSLGKGIIRLSRQGTEGWLASFTTVGGTRRATYPNLLKFFSAISGKMKTVRYLVQQGLTLIESSGRPVDFRALAQKNGSGAWVVTSIVGRTAGSQHYVSNLARGGTLAGVRDSVAKSNLPQMFRGSAYARLKRAALDIAKGVDTRIPAHFGELGIDLALDTGGRVWLLEVNSKPSKNDNTPLNEGKIRPSVRMMIQYARYLSGF